MNPENQNLQPVPPRRTSGTSIIALILSHWVISWILIPALLIFTLHNYVFSAYHVVGNSMIPTLQNSDYLIISKVSKTKALLSNKKYIPERNEIVVFHYPKQPELDFVKRVVGLPGDRVVIAQGQVRVYSKDKPGGFNPDVGHEIAGTYTLGDFEDNAIDVIIPSGNVFVLGDNRMPNGSSDSREWGFLESEYIVGDVALRLYPFSKSEVF